MTENEIPNITGSISAYSTETIRKAMNDLGFGQEETENLINMLKEICPDYSLRLQVATIALTATIGMVGRSGDQYERAADMAVRYGDALLERLSRKD